MLKRRGTEESSIAFLDVISCGFGAIILLLMITRNSAPVTIEVTEEPAAQTISELQRELFEVRGETSRLDEELNARREQLAASQDSVARLRRELSSVQGQYRTTVERSEENELEAGRLAIARQALTDEMQRLLGQSFSRENDVIGGIPVDSEYIIFVIDTSGSMYQNAWSKMLEVVVDTLEVYPEVKGIQVMNDMGDYMFDSYRGEWIPDTQGRRDTIIRTLRNWNPFSNSSPVEGVTRAINTFYQSDRKISIYVIGDDFQPGGSISQVIETVDRINLEDEQGNRRVRIHAIGFPVIFELESRFHQSVYRYANLMRELTQRNGGTFVGLNAFRD